MLSANFDPTDKKYTNQLRAAQILEPIFARQPDHPGVAHYLIHSYDYPPIAQQGLGAARSYTKIAPDAPRRRPWRRTAPALTVTTNSPNPAA